MLLLLLLAAAALVLAARRHRGRVHIGGGLLAALGGKLAAAVYSLVHRNLAYCKQNNKKLTNTVNDDKLIKIFI